MNCPLCDSDQYCKNGFNGYKHEGYTNRKQRYKCLLCNYTYTRPEASTANYKNWGYSEEVRTRVIEIFRNKRKKGKPLSYRKIASLIGGGITHGTVRNWIVTHLEQMDERPTKKVKPAPFTEDDAGYLV